MVSESTTLTIGGYNDLELVVDRWGSPSDVPVLLLHGGGQNRHAWKGTARRLVGSGYQVFAPDARGHGDSGWSTDAEYDMEHFAGDLDYLLALVEQRPIVVGASMGGMIALMAQGQSDQQLFSSVVLVDVTPRMEPEGVKRIMGFMAGHPDGFESLDAAADVVAAYNPHRKRPRNADGLRKVLHYRDGRWRWRWDPRWLSGKAELASDNPGAVTNRMEHMADELHQAASRLTVPTLLVRGAESDLVSPDAAREFLGVVPHADYVDVSDTGHMVAGDDNDAFSDAVLRFLATHVPAISHKHNRPSPAYPTFGLVLWSLVTQSGAFLDRNADGPLLLDDLADSRTYPERSPR